MRNIKWKRFALLLPVIPAVSSIMVFSSVQVDKRPVRQQLQVRPNIVYVLTDEWRAQATGYAGDPNVKTPNLDRLAKESVNFSNAVSVLPVCTPYRAALLTGRYPEHTGMVMNDLYLPADELTMAEIYGKAGYTTGYIGKWHLDGHGRQSFIPEQRRQGFGYWKANECTHNYNKSIYYANQDTTARYWPGYDAYAQTKDAEQYIKEHAVTKKPFVLVVAYGSPHFPHATAPANIMKRYNPASIILRRNVPDSLAAETRKEAIGYYAHCTALDSCVGMLRKSVLAAGIDKNTIFIFTSDHGEMLGSHSVHAEAKQRPWDESIKVPFLVYYPGLAGRSKQDIKVPLNTPDILPTLLSLCNIPKPPTIEGDDLSGLIKGVNKMTDRSALVMNMAPFAEGFDVKEFRGIRTSRYTYVRELDGPSMLYDNIQDPYQMNNLVNDAKFKTLQGALDKDLKTKLTALGDTFEDRAYYIRKWGLKVKPKNGEIPYGPGPYPAQSPASR